MQRAIGQHLFNTVLFAFPRFDGEKRRCRESGREKQRYSPYAPDIGTAAAEPDCSDSEQWQQESQHDWKVHYGRVERIGQHVVILR
jgi:hypothetical protein